MTSSTQKRSLDYFYKKFSEGHSNIDPSFSSSSFDVVTETINKIDGMLVKLTISSTVYKFIQRRENVIPQSYINHSMSYRIEWKYCSRLLFDWNVSCIIKNPLEIRKNISKVLKHLQANLASMKVNKYSGKLNCVEVFEGFGDMYLVDDICCICLDKTMTKTSCNHSICIECCNHMKVSSPHKDLVCPLCRTNFVLQNYDTTYDDSSDDDSDDEDNYDGDENYNGDDDENDNENGDENEIENVVNVIEIESVNVIEIGSIMNVIETDNQTESQNQNIISLILM
jgi:hypothetical protein